MIFDEKKFIFILSEITFSVYFEESLSVNFTKISALFLFAILFTAQFAP